MADEPSSPANTPARAGKNQRTPSAAQGQQKRTNNRTRKTANHHITDGTVSDGALANPAVSPQAHRTRQSVAMGAVQGQGHHNLSVNRPSAQKARPVSYGGNLNSNTPMAEQAYAGPTFQASPAASALPMPKFFSKSVPNVSGQPSLQGRLAGEKTPEEQEGSSPESDRVSPVPLRQTQSPLDLFFKADRAEKERTQSGSHSPEVLFTRPHPATVPRNLFQPGSRNALLRELDGDDSDLPSPRTVPSKNRPPTFERAHSSPLHPTSDADRQTCTNSLKSLLFDTTTTSTSPAAAAAAATIPRADSPFFTPGAQSPFQHRAPSGPTTPQSQTTDNYHYGNRNLSPLFKAAAVRETPPSRPSTLRQEMAPNEGAAPYNPRPQSGGEINHNAFARSYLDEQIRSSAPAEMPPFRPTSRDSYAGSVPVPMPNRPTSSSTTPRAGTTTGGSSSRDIRTMEDDLRRMLKLNV